MTNIATNNLPAENPLYNLEGAALFDAVFAHLSGDELTAKVTEEATANAAAVIALGGPVSVNSIYYDPATDKIVYGYKLT